MTDLEIEESKPYKELLEFYQYNYSLGNLKTDINNKFALISLICYLTYKTREKKPDVTHYMIIQNITKGMNLPYKFIKALAIICDDFSFGCTEFPTFGFKGKNILNAIKEILNKYTPF